MPKKLPSSCEAFPIYIKQVSIIDLSAIDNWFYIEQKADIYF